jgi:hypothetical protein
MITGIFILVLSFAALLFSISMGKRSLRLLRWPQTTAAILDKEVVRSDKALGPTPSARWEVRLSYTYSVNGKEYRGDKIWPYLEVLNKENAAKLMNKLETGIPVYYNPADPAEAYLRRNSLAMAVITFFIGLTGTVIGLGMILVNSESGTPE